MLGLGPRDEGAAVDPQAHVEELDLAQEVLQGLARAALLHQRPQLLQLGLRQRALELQVELHARQPEDVADEELRVQAGVVHAPRLEKAGRLPDDLEDGEHGGGRRPQSSAAARGGAYGWPVSAASFSAKSACWRAAMIASRSPSRTCGRLWRVSPIRWSVTRFWGKL